MGNETIEERRLTRLLKDLNHSNKQLQQNSMDSLVKMDKLVVEPLINILKDHRKDISLRESSAVVLGEIGDQKALTPLHNLLLEDKHWRIRTAVVRALGKLDHERVVDIIIHSLYDADEVVRREGAEILGILKDPRAVRPLCEVLDDNDKHVRFQVIQSLKNLSKIDVKAFLEAIQDENHHVRKNAIKIIGKHQGDPQIVPALINVLRTDSKIVVRQEAAEHLGWIGDDKATQTLIDTLHNDEDAIVREIAIRALGRLKSAQAVDPLINALQDAEEDNIRERAAEALGQINDTRAIVPLSKALKDISIREAARWALEELAVSFPNLILQTLILACQDTEVDDKFYFTSIASVLYTMDPSSEELLPFEPQLVAMTLVQSNPVVRKLVKHLLNKLS